MKKKDKFISKDKEIKINNVIIEDIEDIDHLDTTHKNTVKTAKKPLENREQTQKSNLNLEKARVVEVKTNYTYKILLPNKETKAQELKNCILGGRLKYLEHSTRNPVCIGDFVQVDTSSSDMYRIEEICQRQNCISRYVGKLKQHVAIAANIDQMVIVVSVADPAFNAALIDRYLCAAKIAHIPSLICVNKVDLCHDLTAVKQECAFYENLGIKVIFLSATTNVGIDILRELLKDKETVFTGHSGTGKSSIINAIEPTLNQKVQKTSYANKKGTHTTSNSKALLWSFGGFLIDTPGIKTLGLKRADLSALPTTFPGFAEFASSCAFADCTHTHESLCNIKEN
ncbi:MAG: ribosome small subunit-dependent GTPase A, partial [Candidatus Cloacimonetes bacterium]|nr:ribosome small subunit-dependent GTPase A [Candidatus Cloacimonadota bacterium]